MCTMSTHYSEFVLVFPAMELLIRRCQWYICKNQRMVSLDSVYDEALDAIHTIEPIVVNKWKVTDNLKNKEWFLQAVTTVKYLLQCIPSRV